MYPPILEKEKIVDPVRLPSHCDIRTASELHAELSEAFRVRDEVEIDGDGVEHADVTCIQLLAAAAKTAEAVSKPMRVLAMSEPLRGAFARAGLRVSRSDAHTNWA
jgi:anti-anti-sigma regulatory factor